MTAYTIAKFIAVDPALNPNNPTYEGAELVPLAKLAGRRLHGVEADWLDLSRVDLTSTRWLGVRAKGAYLSESNLTGAVITYSDLEQVNADGIVAIGSYLEHVNFWGASLANANFRGAVLANCDFAFADLRGASFHGAVLIDCRLDNARLDSLQLEGTQLERCSIQWAYLSGVDITDAEFTNCILGPDTLRGAIRRKA